VAEQRYKAVLAVIGEGRTVTEVAAEWRVCGQIVHTWLARYQAGGLEAFGRPVAPADGVPTPDVAGAGGDGARSAAGEAVLGAADRGARSSGRRLHDGKSVSDVDAPPLLVYRAMVRPAQGDQIVELGRTALRPVDDVVPVNPQMYVERRATSGDQVVATTRCSSAAVSSRAGA